MTLARFPSVAGTPDRVTEKSGTIAARDPTRVLEEVRHTKGRFGLPETAPVVSCDEAGREGF
jgi:hypothetical protein